MREFKAGDKVRVLPHEEVVVNGTMYYSISLSVGRVFTLKERALDQGRPEAWLVEEGPIYLHPTWIELVPEPTIEEQIEAKKAELKELEDRRVAEGVKVGDKFKASQTVFEIVAISGRYCWWKTKNNNRGGTECCETFLRTSAYTKVNDSK